MSPINFQLFLPMYGYIRPFLGLILLATLLSSSSLSRMEKGVFLLFLLLFPHSDELSRKTRKPHFLGPSSLLPLSQWSQKELGWRKGRKEGRGWMAGKRSEEKKRRGNLPKRPVSGERGRGKEGPFFLTMETLLLFLLLLIFFLFEVKVCLKWPWIKVLLRPYRNLICELVLFPVWQNRIRTQSDLREKRGQRRKEMGKTWEDREEGRHGRTHGSLKF